jgi:hypothetical protein
MNDSDPANPGGFAVRTVPAPNANGFQSAPPTLPGSLVAVGILSVRRLDCVDLDRGAETERRSQRREGTDAVGARRRTSEAVMDARPSPRKGPSAGFLRARTDCRLSSRPGSLI